MSERQIIAKADLIEIANKIMKECKDYVDGIEVQDIRNSNEAFVFSGEYYLNEDGTPSAKTLAVFNVFKFLNHNLAPLYILEEIEE